MTDVCSSITDYFNYFLPCLVFLPCSVDEVVRVCPVREQIGRFHIVHSDVHVSERLWEKVIDLPRHIQDVAHAEKHNR